MTAVGLSIAELNGAIGEVVKYSGDRVGVHFAGRDPVAIRPERLYLLSGAGSYDFSPPPPFRGVTPL